LLIYIGFYRWQLLPIWVRRTLIVTMQLWREKSTPLKRLARLLQKSSTSTATKFIHYAVRSRSLSKSLPKKPTKLDRHSPMMSEELKKKCEGITRLRKLRTRRHRPPSPSSKPRRPTSTSICLTWSVALANSSSWLVKKETPHSENHSYTCLPTPHLNARELSFSDSFDFKSLV